MKSPRAITRTRGRPCVKRWVRSIGRHTACTASALPNMKHGVATKKPLSAACVRSSRGSVRSQSPCICCAVVGTSVPAHDTKLGRSRVAWVACSCCVFALRVACSHCVFALRVRVACWRCVFALRVGVACWRCVFTLRVRVACSHCVFALLVLVLQVSSVLSLAETTTREKREKNER